MIKYRSYLLIVIVQSLATLPGHCQLTVTNGASWNVVGSTYSVLTDVGLINNGSFTNTASTVKFSGVSGNNLGGANAITFNTLEIAKSTGSILLLQNDCSINQSILFTSGLIDISNRIISLTPTALLTGENQNSRITTTGTGYLTISSGLNAPVAANPGNLGAIITSTQDLGLVNIRRGHQPQSGVGITSSIKRYFDISPTNNTGLNATLRFLYFDVELNGLAETSLGLVKSSDNVNWSTIGYTTRDAVINYVEKTGIPDFSRCTLSNVSFPLPVRFISIDASCNNNLVQVRWKTTGELDIAKYDVMRSTDGIHWTVVTSVLPLNSNTINNYTVTDTTSFLITLYRIEEIDNNGTIHYSTIARSSCSADNEWKLWPNPVQDQVSLQLSVPAHSSLTIKIIDAKGSLVNTYKKALLPGINQFGFDMQGKPAGLYLLVAEWDNGQQKRSVQIIKQ